MTGQLNWRELVSEITKSSAFYEVLSVPSGPASWVCNLHSHLRLHADKDSILILTLCCQCLEILNFIFELGYHQSLGQWTTHTGRKDTQVAARSLCSGRAAACAGEGSGAANSSHIATGPVCKPAPRDSPKPRGRERARVGPGHRMVVVIVTGLPAQQSLIDRQ